MNDRYCLRGRVMERISVFDGVIRSSAGTLAQ